VTKVLVPRATVPVLLSVLALEACTGLAPRREVYRLPAPYNFAFYDTYEAAARSFYAAHYAHFRVYEVGLTKGEDDRAAFDALADRIRGYIERPPKFEPPAVIIAPEWSKIAYRTGQSMDWTHMLHSQLYDILSDDRVGDKKAAGERAIAYYLSEPEAAFSTRPYGHAFMECGGTWAGRFREKYPEINGILWAYHWHHAAVYEALMEPEATARRRAVDRVIRVFEDSVLADPPSAMPLTREVAPRFAELFPAAANIFDNLHMMHDVVNDIMVDDRVADKGFEIEKIRRLMVYRNQDFVIPPAVPMGHGIGHDGVGQGRGVGRDRDDRQDHAAHDTAWTPGRDPTQRCRPGTPMRVGGGGAR
jgi:hypothetical protein